MPNKRQVFIIFSAILCLRICPAVVTATLQTIKEIILVNYYNQQIPKRNAFTSWIEVNGVLI